MSAAGWLQLVVLIVALITTIGPFGRYMAKVYGASGTASAPGDRVFGPLERAVYRVARIDPDREQDWRSYALSLLGFSLLSVLGLYGILRLQGALPLNPTDREAVTPWGAFNAAASFVTNTNWQWFSGERTVSHLTQMIGFTVQNFVSAAVGMAVAVALIRGIVRSGHRTLGNFWVDLVRTCVRILLPVATVAALFFVSQGVIQNLGGFTPATPLDPTAQEVQLIPGGPVASQEAIKELGNNGGGPLNANSAHPFENPTGLTNLVQLYLLLLIPFAFTVTYGVFAGSRRQGRVLLTVMMGMWVSLALLASFSEQHGNPNLTAAGADQSMSVTQTGGNLEGKEVRFGPATCGVFAAATTGTSTGAVVCQHDSLTPLGGLAAMVGMLLGEVTPGGAGVGMVGILVNALLAVFVAGLMVGRTPEFLGKKIQAAEMKLVVLIIVVAPALVLGLTAATVARADPTALLQSKDAHGLSEVIYNYASAANNNGSAFGYVDTSGHWFTITQGLAMLAGRFLVIIPALALGGSLVRKRTLPATAGTFPTDSPLFGGLLAGVIVVIAGLTFFPAVALGPVLEHLSL